MNVGEFSTKLAKGRFPPLHLAVGCHLSLLGLTAPGLAPMALRSDPKRTPPIRQRERDIGDSGYELNAFSLWFSYLKLCSTLRTHRRICFQRKDWLPSVFAGGLYPLPLSYRSATWSTARHRAPSCLLLCVGRETGHSESRRPRFPQVPWRAAPSFRFQSCATNRHHPAAASRVGFSLLLYPLQY